MDSLITIYSILTVAPFGDTAPFNRRISCFQASGKAAYMKTEKLSGLLNTLLAKAKQEPVIAGEISAASLRTVLWNMQRLDYHLEFKANYDKAHWNRETAHSSILR